METKKSYVQYQMSKSIIPFSVNNTFWSYNLGGMIDYTLLPDSVSLMGKDAGPLWEEHEYAYITFPDYKILQQFIEHRLITGTSCTTLSPSGTTIRYRNSNGANYLVQQIENWNGDGYGWKDCMVAPLPEPSDSKVENNPRHIIYNINGIDDNQRTRGLFGFTNGDPSVMARYFLRPSKESTRPVVDLLIDEKSDIHNVPFTIICQFSDNVYNFNITGISCKECNVLSLIKSVTSDAMYYITVLPSKLSEQKMTIQIKENVAENKNGLKNLPSEEVELTLSDDIQQLTIEPEEMNQTCSMWFEPWKSNESNHVKVEFGVVASDVFRISFSPILGKSDEHYIIQLGENKNTNSIIYAKGNDESVLDSFDGDFGLGSGNTAIIHIEYKNGVFTFGTGIDFSDNIIYSFQHTNPIDNIQYVSFCGGYSTVNYHYLYVGPNQSGNTLSVQLDTQSPNPTTKPFTITATTSENFKYFNISKLIVSNKQQYISNIQLLNPRQVNFLVSPEYIGSIKYEVYSEVSAFISQSEKESTKSNVLSITYETTELKAEFTATNIERANTIPLTITITFNRDIVSFDEDMIESRIYTCKMNNFKKITSKQYTIDIIPKSIHVHLTIQEGRVYDLEGNPNSVSEKDIYFDLVKHYEISQMNGDFYTFLDTWNSTQVGKIWSTFYVTTSRSIIIALTTANSITNQRIMIYLGLKDSNGDYNLHTISLIDNGKETVISNITKAIGISSSTITPIWFRYNSPVLTIGTGTLIDENMFLNATNIKLSVQYLSFTSGEAKIFIDNIDVGERQNGNNPSVILTSNAENPLKSIPVVITTTFSENVLDFDYTFENAKYQNIEKQSQTVFIFDFYPDTFTTSTNFYIPPATTISYTTSLPNTASNELSYSLGFITSFTSHKYLNKEVIWNRLWKFTNEDDMVVRFTTKTESGIEVLLGNNVDTSNILYRFTFGDRNNDTCKLEFERNGVITVIDTIKKNVADPNNDVPLWISVTNNKYSMGMGSIPDEQVIISYLDINPIQTKTPYFTFIGDDTSFKNIRMGRDNNDFKVEWKYNTEMPIKVLPIHVIAAWNLHTIDFSLSSITSENCKLYNFENVDNDQRKVFSFDATFLDNNDCIFYIKSGVVTSSNGDKNVESMKAVIYYSEEITECDLTSKNNMKFNLYTNSFKSENGSEIYSKFSIKCTDNILIGLSKDEYSTEFYGFYIGKDKSFSIAIGWFTIDNNNITTFHDLVSRDFPICDKDTYIDLWFDVFDYSNNAKTLRIGSGDIMNSNIILEKTDSDHESMKNTSYISFTNVDTSAYIKNIIVGPGKSDKEKPKVVITSSIKGPFADIPIPLTITFSETVSKLDKNKIELTNCRISTFFSSSYIYFAEIIPLSSDYPASIRIAAGVVTDLSGNPNEESNTYQIILDDTSIFSIYYYQDEQTSYTLWYDQWKSSIPGNIIVTLSSYGSTSRCIGFTKERKEQYPIYDICIEKRTLKIRKLKDELSIDTLLSTTINDTAYKPMWIELASNKILRIGSGKVISDSSLFTSYDLTDYEDIDKLQYVSFMGSGYIASFNDIIILPCGSSNTPIPTFKSQVAIPSNIAPIPIDLDFTEAVTGINQFSFESKNGQMTNIIGTGRHYSLNFLPYGTGESELKLLKDVVTSRGGYTNPETSILATYQDQIVNFTYLAEYYSNFRIESSAWKSSSFGTLWCIFTVQCENDLKIRLSAWINGGYPQYVITLSEQGTYDNYITKISEKSQYTTQFDKLAVCHKLTTIDYWISQDKSVIQFGKGKVINEDVMFTFRDSQAIPTNFISFSGGSSTIYYTNITVGPKKDSVLNGIMYSKVSFPTNVREILIYVQWNHDVDDFALEDDVRATNGIVRDFKVIDKSLYSFIYEVNKCGLGQITIPESAAHYTDDSGKQIPSTEFVPLYIDFCDVRPNPIIKGPGELYVSYVPFIISVSFDTSVYGFTSEDIIVSQQNVISGFRKNNELNYQFEIVIIGNSTEIASLYIDENSLTDIYGNENTKSLPITLPQYGSMIKSYSITTNMENSPLYLKQWSTGVEMNTDISFDVSCTNDIHVSYSSELYDSTDLYEFQVGINNNMQSQFLINHESVKKIDGAICKPGEFIPIWFSFHGRVSKFGIGYIEEGNTKMIYEDSKDHHFKYIGLSNSNEPISYRNITVGPSDAMSPRTDITTSAITYVTSRNPIEVNISFTNECLEFDQTKINATNKNIFEFKEVTKTLYTFNYVPLDGVNYIQIPEGICHDSENRNNEKSIPYTFEYTKGSFTCKFETSSGQSVSIAPIIVTLSFSEATEEFRLDIVSITGGFAFLRDLEFTVDKTVYTFKVYFQDFEPTYLSIADGVIHDIYNNRISATELFLLPRYDNTLIAFAPSTGLDGIPFYASPWETYARSNAYVTFSVKCQYSAGIGFSSSMYNTRTDDLYEIELGAQQNTKTTVRKGLNQKVVKTVEGGICDNKNEVLLWVKYEKGVLKIGKGDEIEKNVFLEYIDTLPLAIKFIYFTTYTLPATYSNIEIGPTDLVSPVLEILNLVAHFESIKATYRLSTSGTLWCISLIFPSNQPNSEYIMEKGNTTSIGITPADILLTGLISGAKYDIWCYAEDSDGVSISLDNMNGIKQTITIPGAAKYPIITILYITGRKTSIYIDFKFDKTGYFYALAVKSGSKTPTIETIKKEGISVICTIYDELAVSIVNLETITSYDVYFYSETTYGEGAPMDYVIKNMRTVITDGSCPSFDGKECNNHGECDDGICMCEFGWHKSDCSQQCPGFAEDAECNGNGYCVVNTDSNVECVCDAFYYGMDCSVHCPNDGENECGGIDRGTCDKFTGECKCKKGYKGYNCSGKTMSVGAIVGIIIGVVGVVLIALVVVYLYKTPIAQRIKKKREDDYSMFA